jgi:hypothetical protein
MERAETISARPPVFAKGTASLVTINIFTPPLPCDAVFEQPRQTELIF